MYVCMYVCMYENAWVRMCVRKCAYVSAFFCSLVGANLRNASVRTVTTVNSVVAMRDNA